MGARGGLESAIPASGGSGARLRQPTVGGPPARAITSSLLLLYPPCIPRPHLHRMFCYSTKSKPYYFSPPSFVCFVEPRRKSPSGALFVSSWAPSGASWSLLRHPGISWGRPEPRGISRGLLGRAASPRKGSQGGGQGATDCLGAILGVLGLFRVALERSAQSRCAGGGPGGGRGPWAARARFARLTASRSCSTLLLRPSTSLSTEEGWEK